MAAHFHFQEINHRQTDQRDNSGIDHGCSDSAYGKVIRDQKIGFYDNADEPLKDIRKGWTTRPITIKYSGNRDKIRNFPSGSVFHFMKMFQVVFHAILLFTSIRLSFSVVASISESLSWFRALNKGGACLRTAVNARNSSRSLCNPVCDHRPKVYLARSFHAVTISPSRTFRSAASRGWSIRQPAPAFVLNPCAPENRIKVWESGMLIRLNGYAPP